MTEQKIINHWLYAFGRAIEQQKLTDHVLSPGNFLWHIFSYEYAPCLEGDKARAAFDALAYDKAICFRSGYSGTIGGVTEVGRLASKVLDKLAGQDVYIVAEDFSWTYVKTHENNWCGPYFARRQPEKWAQK